MQQPETLPETLNAARLLGLIAALVLAVGCLLVLRPFLSSLLWAAILVYSTWPAYRFLRERLRLSPGWAAGVMVTAEFLVIGLPLVFATGQPGTEDEQPAFHPVYLVLAAGILSLFWFTRL